MPTWVQITGPGAPFASQENALITVTALALVVRIRCQPKMTSWFARNGLQRLGAAARIGPGPRFDPQPTSRRTVAVEDRTLQGLEIVLEPKALNGRALDTAQFIAQSTSMGGGGVFVVQPFGERVVFTEPPQIALGFPQMGHRGAIRCFLIAEPTV